MGSLIYSQGMTLVIKSNKMPNYNCLYCTMRYTPQTGSGIAQSATFEEPGKACMDAGVYSSSI